MAIYWGLLFKAQPCSSGTLPQVQSPSSHARSPSNSQKWNFTKAKHTRGATQPGTTFSPGSHLRAHVLGKLCTISRLLCSHLISHYLLTSECYCEQEQRCLSLLTGSPFCIHTISFTLITSVGHLCNLCLCTTTNRILPRIWLQRGSSSESYLPSTQQVGPSKWLRKASFAA